MTPGLVGGAPLQLAKINGIRASVMRIPSRIAASRI
jgi:hypothetical protein